MTYKNSFNTLTNNKSFTSLDRQQLIYNDLTIILKLLSCFNKSKNKPNNKPNNNNNNLNNQPISSLSINQSSFSNHNQLPNNNPSAFSSYEFSNFYQTYKQYGSKFSTINYIDLLYLLCRKKVYLQFIQQYLQTKYKLKHLQNFHYQIQSNFNIIINKNNNSPQITLSTFLINNWTQILSKQDIFQDAIQILSTNLAKNWKSNNIKMQKNLQKSSLKLGQMESKIFKTQPNLNTNDLQTINVPQKLNNEINKQQYKKKDIIKQSTRTILNSLQQLKRQMDECQAEMNMAKNNQDRIIQKNRQYSSKKRQYNDLKQVYRKRTMNNNLSNISNSSKSKNIHKQLYISSDQNKSNKQQQINKHGYNNQFIKENNQLSKINQQQSDNLQNDQQDKEQVNQLNKSIIEQSKQKISNYVQESQLSVSLVIDQQNPKLNVNIINKQNHSEKQLQNNIQYLKPYQYDNLINILQTVKKNQIRQQRLKTLTDDKVINPLQQIKPNKKHLSIDTNNNFDTIQQPQQQYSSILKNNIKSKSPYKNKSLLQNPLLHSPKQYLLDTYIKKVYNYYIMQQSKMKAIHLFDSSLSGSQLGYNILNTSVSSHNTNKLTDISPHLRKKFSLQANNQPNQQIIYEKRRKSLASAYNSNQRNNYNTTIRKTNNHARVRTLTSSIQSSKQSHLLIQSYSKFIRAFQLCNKTVTFNQIISLFKQKSQNKKSINYNQFLQLFQLIYKLQCQKLDVQFTPLLFDAYLRKQVFQWNKINRVLRIKTIGINNKGDIRYSFGNNQAGYKYNLVSHSGMLSEQITQKINASKKPFNKMPCMNRLKTVPVMPSEDLPKSKIQQKIEQIKKLKQLQKARKARDLQEYLKQARSRDEAFSTIKDELRDKSDDSYTKRFKHMQNRRRQLEDKKKNKLGDKNKIFNSNKLRQMNMDPIQQSQLSQPAKGINKKGSKYKNSLQQMSKQIQSIYGKDVSLNNKKQNKMRMKTYESKYQSEQNQRKQIGRGMSNNMDRKVENEDMKQLQKLIGIRQSSDQDQYQNDQFDQQDNIGNKRGLQNNSSKSYNKSIIQGRSKQSTSYQPITIMNSSPINQLSNSNNKQSKIKQQDEFLANYLAKQQQSIGYLQTINRNNDFNYDISNQDRQKWKIHF